MLSTMKLQKKKTFFKRCKAYFWDYFVLWGIDLVVAGLWEMPYKFFRDSVVIHFLFNPFPLPPLLDQPSLAWYKWIVGICGGGFIGGFFTPLGIIVAASYYTVSWYKWGATLGQFLSGLRVVSIEGKPLSFQRSLLRYIGCLFSALVLGLGFLWILIDKRGQGWHDKIASTAVLPIEVLKVSGKM